MNCLQCMTRIRNKRKDAIFCSAEGRQLFLHDHVYEQFTAPDPKEQLDIDDDNPFLPEK